MNQTALIVFLKNFQPGRVKTRLARTMGGGMAMKIYRMMCDYTISEVRQTGLPTWFYFSDYVDKLYLEECLIDPAMSGYNAFAQSGQNLGIRIHRAFEEVLTTCRSAIIVGTDCPYLDRTVLQEAENKLSSDQTDVVIGPAKDGGYYALGMKQSHDLFTGVNWSTGEVFNQTIKRIHDLNLRYVTLPTLEDVDYESDWLLFLSSPDAKHFQDVIRASSSSNDTKGDL